MGFFIVKSREQIDPWKKGFLILESKFNFGPSMLQFFYKNAMIKFLIEANGP